MACLITASNVPHWTAVGYGCS